MTECSLVSLRENLKYDPALPAMSGLGFVLGSDGRAVIKTRKQWEGYVKRVAEVKRKMDGVPWVGFVMPINEGMCYRISFGY